MPNAHGFFPYDPRGLRAAVVACAVVSAALAALAVSAARESGAAVEFVRAAVYLALLSAFAWTAFRIRRREGWGVTVDGLGVAVSRPLGGDPVRVVWSQISEVQRDGPRRSRVALVLRPEGRLVVPRSLFRSAGDFDALARALEERFPVRHDA
jgi:hypothetical protein